MSTGTSAGSSAGSGTGSGASAGSGAASGAASPDGGAGDGGMMSGVVPAKDIVCTQVMGVSITYDWFTNGFDMAPLDTTRWQLKCNNVAGVSFIQQWADPNSALWNIPVTSPCAKSSANPDRIIFVGVNWMYTTSAEWVSAYEMLLATLKSKYSNLKRVDLMTMLRAPGNVLCANNNSTETIVAPFIDQAIQTEVAAHPTFLTAAPKFYVPSCADFLPNSPHLVTATIPDVAAVLRSYYANEP